MKVVSSGKNYYGKGANDSRHEKAACPLQTLAAAHAGQDSCISSRVNKRVEPNRPVGRLSSSFGENTFFHGKLRTLVCLNNDLLKKRKKKKDAHQPLLAMGRFSYKNTRTIQSTCHTEHMLVFLTNKNRNSHSQAKLTPFPTRTCF